MTIFDFVKVLPYFTINVSANFDLSTPTHVIHHLYQSIQESILNVMPVTKLYKAPVNQTSLTFFLYAKSNCTNLLHYVRYIEIGKKGTYNQGVACGFICIY